MDSDLLVKDNRFGSAEDGCSEPTREGFQRGKTAKNLRTRPATGRRNSGGIVSGFEGLSPRMGSLREIAAWLNARLRVCPKHLCG